MGFSGLTALKEMIETEPEYFQSFFKSEMTGPSIFQSEYGTFELLTLEDIMNV